METIYTKATIEDRDEIMDLGNYVFSHSHSSVDFPSTLPKLYKSEFFMDSFHYIVKEDGRIKAAIGAYPLELETVCASAGCGCGGCCPQGKIAVPGRGIGMVSVHPYRRSKGYMKALMKMAMDDMKKDGIVFSCLGGQRQRYEYFGFYPVGSNFSFTCSGTNIRHLLGSGFKSSLTIEKVNADNAELLDAILAMHGQKSFCMKRDRKKLFDILSSWKAETYIVKEGSSIEGYFIYNGHDFISEIILKNYSRLIEIPLLLKEKAGHDLSVKINAGPHEKEKIAALSRFAEYYNQAHTYQFAVLDYVRFTDALIKHKAGLEKISEGSFVIKVEDKTHGHNSTMRLFAGKGGAGVAETTEAPVITMNSSEASAFLFSPLAFQSSPLIRENEFLRSLLPLPLFVEEADKI